MSIQERPVGRVVVGYDGSSASVAALDAGRQEAVERGLPLHLVCVVRSRPHRPVYERSHRTAAAAALEAARRRAERAGAGEVTRQIAVGDPGAELLKACRPTDLLVVGTHGHRPVARMLLGSVSTAAAAHAPCPVLVARGPRQSPTGPVVVGVDGSPASRAAFGYAAEVAARTGAGLRAVQAVSPDADALGFVTAADERDLRRAQRTLQEAVAAAAGRHPALRVEELLVQAHPVDALLRHGRDARLVVVGSRGRGGVRAMVLGSVSRELLQRSDCPVAVVRVPKSGGAAEAPTEAPTAIGA
jgi:nucleotide-binding universal stress UspA family protein